MLFQEGDKVEVCSKMDGFEGSYFAATVISTHPSDMSYSVKYKNLVEDDWSRPLVETVSWDEVRPLPPRVIANGFRLNDKVDAFDNDGWWVGRINGRKGTKYFVYFEECRQEISYHLSELRVHQDLINGSWVFGKKTNI